MFPLLRAEVSLPALAHEVFSVSYYTVVTANTAVPGCETYPGAGTYCVGGSPFIVSVPAKKRLLTIMLTGLSALLLRKNQQLKEGSTNLDFT